MDHSDDDIPDSPVEDEYEGDYSTRMEELLDSGGESEDGDSDSDGFFYNGTDANTSGTAYKDQLADVLEDDDSNSESDPKEAEEEQEASIIQVSQTPELYNEASSLVLKSKALLNEL